MSENLRAYVAAMMGLEHAVRSVPDHAWDHQSPCEAWTVRDVAGHAMAVVQSIATRLGQAPAIDPFDNPRQYCGDDAYGAWCDIRDRVLAALDQPGSLRHLVTMGGADVTLDDAIGTLMCDALIHTWDIARGSGGDERLDARLVAAAQAVYDRRDAAGILRSPGRYGAAAATSADADPQTRLLTFVGRTV